jgi:hypothetical protein
MAASRLAARPGDARSATLFWERPSQKYIRWAFPHGGAHPSLWVKTAQAKGVGGHYATLTKYLLQVESPRPPRRGCLLLISIVTQLRVPFLTQMPVGHHTSVNRFSSFASAVPNKHFNPYPKILINPLVVANITIARVSY